MDPCECFQQRFITLRNTISPVCPAALFLFLPAEEGYDSRQKEYTLSGNGQGVYWCVDACALAHVENPPVRGSFTFTARVKEVALPEHPGPAHIEW